MGARLVVIILFLHFVVNEDEENEGYDFCHAVFDKGKILANIVFLGRDIMK